MQIAINDVDIMGCAQSLRPHHRVISTQKIRVRELAGGWRNLHVNVDFDDGAKWIARIPRLGFHSHPRIIQRTVTKGEIDVMIWLRSVPKLPVPEVMSAVFSKSSLCQTRITSASGGLDHGATDFYFQEFL